MENVVCEIYVIVSICSSYIIALATAALNKLLEVGNDGIITSLACIINTEVVVYLLTAVERENNVVAFLVKELHHLVGKDHTVCGIGKAEVLAALTLNLSCILNKALYNVKVKRGLTAEEVNLKVTSCTRVFHKEIKSALTNLKGHKRSVTLILRRIL